MARTTIKDLEAGQVALAGQLAQVTEALTALASGGQAQEQDDAPEAKATKKAAKKAAPKVIRQNLDPETVAVGERTFRVAPSGPTGIYTTGARIVPVTGTKKDGSERIGRSLTRADVEAIAEDASSLLAAMDEVEKRAKVGEHAPAK
jgi:hypothetical protein